MSATCKRKEPYRGEPKGAYRPAEFQIRYGIGHTKLYQILGSGQVPSRKLGRATVVLHEDAEAWARSLPIARAVEVEA
jgi:hypothetical protein